MYSDFQNFYLEFLVFLRFYLGLRFVFSFIYYYLSVLKSTILTSTDTGFRLVSGLVSNVH